MLPYIQTLITAENQNGLQAENQNGFSIIMNINFYFFELISF